MLNENVKWVMFLLMLILGISSLAAFIAAQVYVKSTSPELWQQFFPGRSVAFAHDLKFYIFADWIFSAKGRNAIGQLPWLPPLWRYYSVANKLAFVPCGILFFDFLVVVYQSGMIGGWRFR